MNEKIILNQKAFKTLLAFVLILSTILIMIKKTDSAYIILLGYLLLTTNFLLNDKKIKNKNKNK